MTYSDLQDNPTGPAIADPFPLPANAWTPALRASIVVYWQQAAKEAFDVVLQLVDPVLLEEGDPGFIVRGTVGVDRRQLPFSLGTGTGAADLLAGWFEYRLAEDHQPPEDGQPPKLRIPQLWLVDAVYPGGRTAAARITSEEK